MRINNEKLSMSVLFVEDDSAYRDSLRRRLEKRRIAVTAAATAEEALRAVQSNPFDCVLTDITVPGMDGIEFLSRMRRIQEDLPCIIITGAAEVDIARKAVALHADGYLLKPFERIEELLTPLRRAVDGYRLSRENRKLQSILSEKIVLLEEKTQLLEQKNSALRELLLQFEREKQRIHENVVANIDQLLMPVIRTLHRQTTTEARAACENLMQLMRAITDEFGRKIAGRQLPLTKREREIAALLRYGGSAQTISRTLNISEKTLERHRNNIRTKLGLVNQQINLTTYLKQL